MSCSIHPPAAHMQPSAAVLLPGSGLRTTPRVEGGRTATGTRCDIREAFIAMDDDVQNLSRI
jgi:hypothetical protein